MQVAKFSMSLNTMGNEWPLSIYMDSQGAGGRWPAPPRCAVQGGAYRMRTKKYVRFRADHIELVIAHYYWMH